MVETHILVAQTALFVAGIINLSLGVYVLAKNPKGIVNKAFAFMIFCAAVWSIGFLAELTFPTLEQKILASHFAWPSIMFLCPTFFLLTLVFPKKRKITENKLIYALYLPPFFLFISLLTNDIHHLFLVERSIVGGVMKTVWGPIFWIHAAISYSFVIAAIIMVASSYWQTKEPIEKKQYLLFLAAALSPFVMNILFVPLRVPFPIDPTPVFFILTGIFLTVAIVRYGLFILPSSEELLWTKPKYKLEPGFPYLAIEERPARAYEIFTDQVTHGRQGVCLSKLEAEKIRKRYGLEKTPVVQLSLEAGEKIPSFKNIKEIKALALGFVRRAERPIILVDCFGEMKMVNGFEPAKKFLEEVKREISETDSNLLISLNPYLFTGEQLDSVRKTGNVVCDTLGS